MLSAFAALRAVCTGIPEAPAGGSFDCGNSSVAGTVCNGTCSTGGGPITAECQSTGNWTVQGTCAQIQPGGEPGVCLAMGRDAAKCPWIVCIILQYTVRTVGALLGPICSTCTPSL